MTIEFAIISNNYANIEILAFNVTNGKEIKEAYKKAKEQDAKEALSATVPDIIVTGEVDKENGKYMIFKYDNKIFTLKEGDKFDNNIFTVKKIEGNILEIEDVDGNVFSYSK